MRSTIFSFLIIVLVFACGPAEDDITTNFTIEMYLQFVDRESGEDWFNETGNGQPPELLRISHITYSDIPELKRSRSFQASSMVKETGTGSYFGPLRVFASTRSRHTIFADTIVVQHLIEFEDNVMDTLQSVSYCHGSLCADGELMVKIFYNGRMIKEFDFVTEPELYNQMVNASWAIFDSPENKNILIIEKEPF